MSDKSGNRSFLSAKNVGQVWDRLAALIQEKRLQPFLELQATEISSVIKWRPWSISLTGMLVTHCTGARHIISLPYQSREQSHWITSLNIVNKGVILTTQTLIKLPDTFIKLSQCNGWSACTAAVKGLSWPKASAWSNSETCHLFEEWTPPKPWDCFRSTVLSIAERSTREDD